MDKESQRFMSLEGVHTWVAGTIRFASECDAFLVKMGEPTANYTNLRRAFEVSRHSFLIAAFKLLEYAQWSVTTGALDAHVTAELEGYADRIKLMRDLNEHKLEYFQGGGRKRPKWAHAGDNGDADASSTIDTRIGNLLDWREVAEVASRLQLSLR